MTLVASCPSCAAGYESLFWWSISYTLWKLDALWIGQHHAMQNFSFPV